MIGTWKPTAARNSVRVETVLNRSFNREEKKALDTAIDAYGKFVGLTPSSSY